MGFIPVSELKDQPMQVNVNTTAFLGYPTSLNPKKSGKEDEDDSVLLLDAFNLVFAVQWRRCSPEMIEMLRRCVFQISTVLKREEERVSYLTEQCGKMFKVRDKWLQAQQEETKPSHADLGSELLKSSSLAEELAAIYAGLSRGENAHVKINNWITLSLSVNSISAYPSLPIRPYETMLIIHPELVPPDSSPDLLRFVGFCRPSKSFQDMQIELNIPLAQIFRMAAHLLYWKIGRIVTTMTTSSVYVVQSQPHLVTADVKRQFAAEFDNLDLLQQLQRFSMAKSVKQHLSEISVSSKQFSEILVFLLKKDLVVQVFTYLMLIIPQQPQDGAFELVLDEQKSNKVKFSESEKAHLEELTKDKTPLDLLFLRLCAYGHGNHHLDEIVWRENLTLKDVEAVSS